MFSEKLKKLLEGHPKIIEQLNQVVDKFEKRTLRLGQVEPILTRETMYLMAVEMQMILSAHNLHSRIVIEKRGDGGANITLAPPERKRLFKPKGDNDGEES